MSVSRAISGDRQTSHIITSISSASSADLGTLTTCNCELAVLPVLQFLQQQKEYFSPEGYSITVNHHHGGGYNVCCEGEIWVQTQRFTVSSFLKRKTVLKSHEEYRDYRENLLSKPLVLFTSVIKNNTESPVEKTFAVVVNTRHPKIRRQIEQGMDQAISSATGENYSLKFELQNVVKTFFFQGGYSTDGEGLDFSYEFKTDSLFDVFYMLGCNKRKAEINGKILNLSCNVEEKKNKVKMFLDKMSEPFIRIGSSADRRFSNISVGSKEEDDVFS
ncbi:mesenteric estrogen-dependent adipogenesis protein [Protopterus annectens]|uniref:mesenteric estrogen-dependent adipogenesis protein n=1 Tax=Protopterus annectens TaxID=7888 RepID=UPI001CFA511D|nr:mesenteric estrogen-dependent adipogenesis protein [Protopterus annectens]